MRDVRLRVVPNDLVKLETALQEKIASCRRAEHEELAEYYAATLDKIQAKLEVLEEGEEGS